MMYPSMLSHYTINYADHSQKSSPQASFRSYSASSTPTRPKRRNSDYEDNFKKVKQSPTTPSNKIPTEKLTLENINLNEYPKFHHPDGGFIQFTPIGNVRTWMGDDNIVRKTIEKNSSFDLNKLNQGIDGYTLYLGDNRDSGIQIDSSPSNEVENYMRVGYSGTGPSGSSTTGNTGYYDDGGSSASRLQYFFDDDDEFDSDENME
ncbi:hypothetical protein KL907_001518 [Ogataea polymorpha]|nr:hypothetical protein KL936_002294 [Ogataea polymorpha]KAG7910627.1 hypothetical protein KL907_001518 [Ogataea polymorpha]